MTDQRLAAAVTAVVMVMQHQKANNIGRGQQGSIECPLCKGRLLYYVTDTPKMHKRAACSTPDCLQFLE